jgi:hypothetical protein
MTDESTSPPAPDAELAKNMTTVKRGIDARVGEIKRIRRPGLRSGVTRH